MTQEKQLIVGESLSKAWKIVTKYFWFFAVIVLIDIAVNLPMRFITDSKTGQPTVATSLYWIVYIAVIILAATIGLGTTKIALNLSRGKAASYADLFSQFSKVANYIVAGVMIAFSVILTFFLPVLYALFWLIKSGWSKVRENTPYFIALIFVPWIVLAIQYMFTSYVIVDQNASPIEAMKKSAEMAHHNFWNLFSLGLAEFGVILLGALLLGVGIFWAIPLTIMATAFSYRFLSDK